LNLQRGKAGFLSPIRFSVVAEEEYQPPPYYQDEAWESLKHYVSYFQSQMALLYSCNDDVVAAAFISGLQVTYTPFASTW